MAPPRAGCRVSHGRSSAGQSDGHRLEACRWWGRWTRMAGPQKGKWLGRRSDPFGPLANNAGCGSAPEKRLWPITRPAPRCLRRDSRLIDAHRFAAGACRRDVYKSDFTTLAAVYKGAAGGVAARRLGRDIRAAAAPKTGRPRIFRSSLGEFGANHLCSPIPRAVRSQTYARPRWQPPTRQSVSYPRSSTPDRTHTTRLKHGEHLAMSTVRGI